MAVAKRPPLPLILTANDLLDGDVVFHTGEAWSRELDLAFVAADEEAAATLEQALAASQARGDVVEPYLVTVATDAEARPAPNHYRERIRTFGPTIDFGPGSQTQTGAY